MKKICEIFFVFFLPVLFVTNSYGECEQTKTMKVQFGNPEKPGILKLVSGKGDIKISGYNGRDVMIEKHSSGTVDSLPDENAKAEGMKRISGSGFNVTTVDEENTIVISRSMKKENELVIQVPFNTLLIIGGSPDGGSNVGMNSLMNFVMQKITSSLNPSGEAGAFSYDGGLFEGNITAENVSGDIVVSTMDGGITLRNISGEVMANAMDGDILVTFKSVSSKNPMAFSTLNGDIDITFPPDLKSTITARNIEGDIFTDFDMELSPVIQQTSEEKGSGLPHGLAGLLGNSVSGTINGGGPDIHMTTIDGDIYIRKVK